MVGRGGPVYTTSAEHFERAVNLHERLRARPLLARSCLQYAAAIFSGRAAGSRERARGLAERARDEAAALGMPGVQADALALLAGVGQPAQIVSSRPRYPDGLTARE